MVGCHNYGAVLTVETLADDAVRSSLRFVDPFTTTVKSSSDDSKPSEYKSVASLSVSLDALPRFLDDEARRDGCTPGTFSAAPVISPFSFPERLQEGMRSSATCTLLDGDPPVTMGWLKDGRPDLGPDVQVVPISDFVSNLIIDKVARHHSGDYTCTAANAAASTNHTAHMFVRALPRWTIRPSDMSTVVGSSVTFDCQAEGEPHPVVRWKYAVGKYTRKALLSSSLSE
ncbi:hypothetical protein HPB51_011505 [Rhipicephalus microplus]|uniref:Ig-like domain-containing protein n=1 Tax=Rhipicephalus microplus TaxID=6941 RepID=A0A9J6D9W4_RHIMP|nr:hypothetical protein HPB51_011505 [Rhipicephalus microplus]